MMKLYIKKYVLPIVAGVCDQVHLCWEVYFLFGTAVTAAKATEKVKSKKSMTSGEVSLTDL